MIGIKAISSYVPGNFIDNISQAASFGESESFVREKIGAIRLSRMEEGQETSDLAVKAVEALLVKSGLERADIGALVVVTQNGDGAGLPHTSAIVQSKLGLPTTIAAFDISLGCSGYVYGLSVLKGFMQSAGLRNGVLVTADPYSKVIDQTNRVTALLFGDAATATLLSEGAEWDVMPPLFGTDGAGSIHLMVKDGLLGMNGRQVFNFASLQIPGHIKSYLERAGLQLEDIDSYCLHQGSAAIIDAIARRFPTVRDRFANEMIDIGNTVSSSIPLLLEQRLNDKALSRILISGFGVGLSWATTLLVRGNTDVEH
jgi:3-oxoacyl-[acyl-carrier-protein] synthase-3